MYNQNDDLKYAISNNGLNGSFTEDNIEKIVAEVPGANDEYSWHWIVKLSTGKYSYLKGWCDYTGWDCRSNLNVISEGTLKDVIKTVSVKDYQGNIQEIIKDQLKGKTAFGSYEIMG